MEFDVLHIKAAVVADNSLAFFRLTWGILDAEISLPEGKVQTFKGVWFTMFRVLNHLFDVRFGFLVSSKVSLRGVVVGTFLLIDLATSIE